MNFQKFIKRGKWRKKKEKEICFSNKGETHKNIIDTANDVILKDKEYYNKICSTDLCKENLCIFTRFSAEETTRFFKIETD